MAHQNPNGSDQDADIEDYARGEQQFWKGAAGPGTVAPAAIAECLMQRCHRTRTQRCSKCIGRMRPKVIHSYLHPRKSGEWSLIELMIPASEAMVNQNKLLAQNTETTMRLESSTSIRRLNLFIDWLQQEARADLAVASVIVYPPVLGSGV